MLLALLLPLAARAQDVLLDFRSTELTRIVESIAQQTGQRFVHDDSLRGNVTISVPQRVSREEALRVLDAALLLHGFAALPGPGGTRKIVRIEGNRGASPFLGTPAGRDSESPVTTLIRLQVAQAADVASALRELGGKSAILSEDPATNAILIAAGESLVRRLIQLARALDQASERELRVLPLRYRDPGEMEPVLEAALAKQRGLEEEVLVVADDRTRSLVIEARREDMERVHALLRSLDLPLPGKRDLHVVRVLNASASDLAESLDALLQDGSLAPKPAGAAAPPEPIRIAVDEPTHSLVIQASAPAFGAIAQVIGELDVPPPRVSVELTVIEVSLTGDVSLGFDSLFPVKGVPDAIELAEEGAVVIGTGTRANVAGLSTPTERFVARVTTEPIVVSVDTPVGPVAVPVAFGGIVRADNAEANFHTLIQPHLLMTSGDEHRIQAGDNIPVPVSSSPTGEAGVVQTPTGSSGFTTNVTFQRQDTGVDVRMKPTVLSENAVALALELDVSQLSSDSGDRGPIIASRKLTATARLRDGEVALIAALRAPERTETRDGIPFIRRIPILGRWFTSTRDVQRRTALIVTAQPTVLGSPADEQARSIRHRLAFQRHLARTSQLAALSDAPYALLVDTRDSLAAARAAAGEARDPRWSTEVVAWTHREAEYWDVYATGFQTIGQASEAAIALRDAGWQPQLTVIPPRPQ
jgi:general secretion pathway protein D